MRVGLGMGPGCGRGRTGTGTEMGTGPGWGGAWGGAWVGLGAINTCTRRHSQALSRAPARSQGRTAEPAGALHDTARTRHGTVQHCAALCGSGTGPTGTLRRKLDLFGTEGATEGRARPLTISRSSTPPLDQLPYDADEFGGLERLGEKGIDPDVQPTFDLVLSAGTDDGEGKITSPRVGTQPSGGPQSIQAGHDDVQGDDIGPHLMNHIQTLDTIGRGHDLKPLQLKIDPDQLPDDLVVVHNKHPTRHARHNSRVGPHQPPRPAFPHFHPRERAARSVPP